MRVIPVLRRGFAPPRLFALAAGLLVALGQAPLSAWPLALIGLVMAVLSWSKARTAGEAAWRGWMVGFGAFLVSLTWLVNPFLVDPARDAWMIPFALFFMCGGLALFWALAFYGAKRLRVGLPGLVALWGLAELARGHVFTGFPWAMPGYIWLDQAPAQLASLIGPYALTTLTFAWAALVARAVLNRSFFTAGAALILMISAYGYGWARLSQPLPQDRPQSIRVVQPNAPQREKWDPELVWTFYERALKLSAPEGADLVIWPETSVSVPLWAADPYLTEIAQNVSPARAIVGLNRVEGYQGYNSAVLVGHDGQPQEIYDKHHLVPFGEYMPMPALLERIGLRAFTAQEGYGYSAGPGPRLIDTGGTGLALPLICYEAIFPRDLRTDMRPDWLLQMTNDAWFGTFSGPQQALAQARFRAIETGLPMVRAANTGISAVIDARGDIRVAIPLGTSGAVTSTLPGALPKTLYMRYGETALWGLLTLLMVSGLSVSRLGTRQGQRDRRTRKTD
ncbi:apolipoprotein N-acyltransferase [Celeribacter baekdonensis]|uniref:Apolipoprotein N-acyltransferase n=1 Tax=Celeribacter baekdonensis TaxID=875171 RepID=A0A1G7JNT5_9RHOB|nr:apolipoprotein N-acyltransferase [Celeribacter baekdonensis]SDF26597.1 apolipoprotein N-acyltransferase [Celeribacter baekdonensis]